MKRLIAFLIRTFLAACYAPMKLMRTRNKITMISRQGDNPSVDFQRLEAALREKFPHWEVEVLCYEFHTSIAKKVGYLGHVFTQMRHIATSRLIVLDTYCIPVSVLRHKRELRVLQMWHALGSLKKFGYSILDVGEGSSSETARAMRMHRNYDAVLTSAEPCRIPFAEAFDTPVEKVYAAPLPRVDVLRDPAWRAERRAALVEAFPELATGKNVLFAPTFHKGQRFAADELHKYFARSGYNLIAKPHPVALRGDDVIAQRYRSFTAFEFLAIADYLVTDYSSIMFEAGVADVPVFVFAPDLEQYTKDRNFYIDFVQEMPGPISKSFDGLLADLEADTGDRTAIREFTRKYVEVPAAGATSEIVRIARELIEGAGA